MIYDFKEDIIKGQFYEAQLDKYFQASGEYSSIFLATEVQQRQGIDRVFVSEKDGQLVHFLVEYKSDWLAGQTRNAFIETVSNNVNGSEGWSVKSKADLLVYYVIGSGMILIIGMDTLRESLPDFIWRYPLKKCQNKNYCSFGRLVPIVELEKISVRRMTIKEEVFHEKRL